MQFRRRRQWEYLIKIEKLYPPELVNHLQVPVGLGNNSWIGNSGFTVVHSGSFWNKNVQKTIVGNLRLLSKDYFQSGMYVGIYYTYLLKQRDIAIGLYLLFIRRGSERYHKNIIYFLTIQHQIFFLNLLNNCRMKSDDESSYVFWHPIWWVKDSTHWLGKSLNWSKIFKK